jgi:hypothetical protein
MRPVATLLLVLVVVVVAAGTRLRLEHRAPHPGLLLFA